MATVTGLTAARMLAIEAASVVDGSVVGDNLILERQNGTTINAGNVRGPAGDPGDVAQLVQWAKVPDLIIAGAITRDASGAAISAPVIWPDDTPGTYTADTVSVDFPGAVDEYHITYGSPVTMTFTQPEVTRNASGAVTNLPAIVVT